MPLRTFEGNCRNRADSIDCKFIKSFIAGKSFYFLKLSLSCLTAAHVVLYFAFQYLYFSIIPVNLKDCKKQKEVHYYWYFFLSTSHDAAIIFQIPVFCRQETIYRLQLWYKNWGRCAQPHVRPIYIGIVCIYIVILKKLRLLILCLTY